METPLYYVSAEVKLLPLVSEEIVRQDLHCRIYRRLCEHMSGLLHPGGSVDWKIAAMQARAQVQALRSGQNPNMRFYPVGQ